jgi:hypothetical protein
MGKVQGTTLRPAQTFRHETKQAAAILTEQMRDVLKINADKIASAPRSNAKAFVTARCACYFRGVAVIVTE